MLLHFKHFCKYKETPEIVLSLNFGLFREDFITSIVYPEIKWRMIKEVSVGWFEKSCKRILGHKMFLVIFQCRKNLTSTPKPDNFMWLFWTFVDLPVCPRCFFIWARNLDEYLTKFILSKFLSFCPGWFITVLLSKSSKWRKYSYREIFALGRVV